jgi:broad specificity phosphatase PhoE
MTNLILVRHGESSGNKERIFAISPHDLPLTELGYSQALAAARRIAQLFRPRIVVSSTYVRASETARVIAGSLGVPLEILPDLHERDVGVHRGRSYDSFTEAPDYDLQQPWRWKPEGGESYQEVQARVGPIVDRLAQVHSDQDIVIVSHGGVMTTLWAYAAGTWDEAHVPPNCGIVLLEHGPLGYSKPRVIDGATNGAEAGG